MRFSTIQMNRLLIVSGLLIICNYGMAQPYRLNENWTIGGNIGMTSFFGDLSINDIEPVKKLSSESDCGWGLKVGKQISPVFTFNLSYYNGKLKGSNPSFGYSFSTNIDEVSLSTDVSLLKIIAPDNTSKFDIYAKAGGGMTGFKSVKNQLGSVYTGPDIITPVSAETDAKSTTFYMAGIGLSYELGNNLKAVTEFAGRVTRTDDLDAQQGSTNIKDYYTVLSLGLTYTLNSETHRHHNTYVSPSSVTHRFNKKRPKSQQLQCISFY